MKDAEYSGVWLRPSNPDKQVGGTLAFSNDDGLRLNLTGSFKGLAEMASFGSHQITTYPIILGVASGGKPVTLSDCQEVEWNFSSGGLTTQEIVASSAYVGAHFRDPAEIRFRKADVEYSHLQDWAGISGFRLDYPRNEKGQRAFEVTYNYPEEVVATTTKGTVRTTFTFHQSGDLLGAVNLKQSVQLRIDAEKDLSLGEWLKEFVSPLQNLLSLGCGRPNAVTRLAVFATGQAIDGSEREVPIEVMYRPDYHEAGKPRRLLPPDMLFTLSDVSDDFGGIVERWLRVADELDSTCNLFFSVGYSPTMYFEQQFLNVVQAAETYHRRRLTNEVLPADEHSARMDSILESVLSEHKSWLKEKLRYANEPALRQRLRDLMDVTASVMEPLVPDRNRFVQKVLDTRNYHVHYDVSVRRKAAESGAELYYLTMVLSFLVQACLLRELGIDPDRRVELFNRNQQYLFAANQAKRRI